MLQQTQNRVMAILCAVILSFTAAAAQASEGAEKKKDGPLYVDFKNIVVPIIKKNGSTGLIALSVMAEVKDDEAKSSVTEHMPKLRDAFIRALYGNLEGNRFVREDGALDIDHIKNRLLKTAAYVMQDKDSPIKDILFQNISQQTY